MFGIKFKNEKKQPKKVSYDTSFDTGFYPFLSFAVCNGFEVGYDAKFMGTGWSADSTPEKEEREVILLNKKRNVIIYAESFGVHDLNCATVYCQLKKPTTLTQMQKQALRSCICINNHDGTLSVSFSAKKDFMKQLNRLSKEFEFCKNFTSISLFRFTNYMETGSAADITAWKLSQCKI